MMLQCLCRVLLALVTKENCPTCTACLPVLPGNLIQSILHQMIAPYTHNAHVTVCALYLAVGWPRQVHAALPPDQLTLYALWTVIAAITIIARVAAASTASAGRVKSVKVHERAKAAHN